jgi:hypothetical protein
MVPDVSVRGTYTGPPICDGEAEIQYPARHRTGAGEWESGRAEALLAAETEEDEAQALVFFDSGIRS